MDREKMSSERHVDIIDDEADVRDGLTFLFATARISSRAFESAEAYLSVQGAGAEASCILLDNRLPGKSGIELLNQLVQAKTTSAVIMMTGHGDIPTAVAAMKLGAFHFVEKPFDSRALLDVVETALARAVTVRDVVAEANAFDMARRELTLREAEVFKLIMEGQSSKLIGSRLGISTRTVEHHRAVVLGKFGVRSVPQLMRLALERAKLDTRLGP